jgi:hypothetical protein
MVLGSCYETTVNISEAYDHIRYNLGTGLPAFWSQALSEKE